MQTVFLPAMIEDNPVRPISSMQAYNRIVQVAMVPRPYAGRSQPSPYREMAGALALRDVPDQIKYLKHRMIVTDIPAGSPTQEPLIPLHSPSKNAGAYENEDEHDLLLQSIFGHGDLFLPLFLSTYLEILELGNFEISQL